MSLTILLPPRGYGCSLAEYGYEIGNFVRRGASGTTCLVRRQRDGTTWVAKCTDLAQLDNASRDNSLKEAQILKSLSHSNVVAYEDSFVTEGDMLVIIMEYCQGGDLATLIEYLRNANKSMTIEQLMDIFGGIVAGVAYIHSHGIAHLDLKPANIILDREQRVAKIADFGLSCKVPESDSCPLSLGLSLSTLQYMAPELWAGRIGLKADIWSLGCILYEMIFFSVPFHEVEVTTLLQRVLYDEIPFPQICPDQGLKRLIGILLAKDADRRPSIAVAKIPTTADGLLQCFTVGVVSDTGTKWEVSASLIEEMAKNWTLPLAKFMFNSNCGDWWSDTSTTDNSPAGRCLDLAGQDSPIAT